MGDVRQYTLREEPPKRQVYRGVGRWDAATLAKWPSRFLVVRTSGDPERLAPALVRLVRSIDPDRRVLRVRTMEEVTFASTGGERALMLVVSLFGGAALLLTLTGLYAVVSHSVSRRAREIAIRVALGGRPGDIGRMVLGQAAAVVGLGLAIGVIGAAVLAPRLPAGIFDASPADIPTLAAAVALIAATALLACCAPVRAASRTDALRASASE